MVAKFAPDAIIVVSVPLTIAITSTIIIVSSVLKVCSIVCEFAVTLTHCLPLKYPLITQISDTKNIDGESDTRLISASGICNHKFAILPA